MIKAKLYTIILHCAGWILFFSLPIIFIISHSIEGNTGLFRANAVYLLSFTIYIAIFYLNTHLLLPKLYFAKKHALYFASILLLFGAVFFLRPFDRLASQNRLGRKDILERPNLPSRERRSPPIENSNGRKPPPRNPPEQNGFRSQRIDIISITLFILVIVLSIAFILEKRWRIAVEETSRMEADKANAELSFLKAQINPHFLFNTLNNIYSLAITKNEHVADAIMKLSNIMRYVTDDVNDNFVPLEKELSSITDYISLQRLRLGKKASISFLVSGNINSKIIAPLILMPFVENAFKHGISSVAESNIAVKLTATDESIVFSTENSLFATPRNTERTGIGNNNTKKRLAQVYPGKHVLDINSRDGLFTVNLVMYI